MNSTIVILNVFLISAIVLTITGMLAYAIRISPATDRLHRRDSRLRYRRPASQRRRSVPTAQ